MPIYEYEAKSNTGQVLNGKMDVVDENAVVESLRKMGYFPTKIKKFSKGLNIDLGELKKVKIKDISIFCRQFSTIITSGISIMRGLEIVKQQTENPKLKSTLEAVLDDVQRGVGLSDAMERHDAFPRMLINMVEIGEASGTLDKIMDRMAIYYEKEYKLSQRVKQALTYPIVLGCVSILVVVFLVTTVIPSFVNMLGDKSALPLPTKIVMGLSNFMVTKWYLLVLGIIGIVGGVIAYKNSDSGRLQLDGILLKLPIYGKIYKKIITSRFARTFGILMGSGVPLIQSFSICSNVVGNAVIKELLDSTSDAVKKGAGIGDTLATKGVFPLMLTQMIKIGEESGTLDEVLEKTSDFYDTEVDTASTQLTTMIEPVIIVALGLVVGFIIISIMLPMFSMFDAISGM